MLQMRTLTGILFLLAASRQDLRERKVSVCLLAAAFFSALAFRGPAGWGALPLMTDLAPGLFLILLSFLLRGELGSGDGAAVLVLGLYAGGFRALEAAAAGMVLLGLTGLFRILSGRSSGRETLPFLPFLTAAHLVMILGRAFGGRLR